MPAGDIRAVHLPYCVDRQPDGRYVILNRNYKPLGFVVNEYVKYDEYPITHHIRITPKKAAKISYKGSEELGRIYLYNDGCIPIRSKKNMDAYLERLAVLMSLKITPEARR
jgi:hypothetical protein